MFGVARGLRLRSGVQALVVIREKTVLRLGSTCFRGPLIRCAGNFHRWRHAHDFLGDSQTLAELQNVMEEMRADGAETTDSFCIDYGFPIGWTSTAPLSGYKAEEMETFRPNRKSSALRMRVDSSALAPQTSFMTVILEFRLEGDKIVGVIHSLYPGEDIGELRGDVSQREGVVFFGWNHPGA